MILLPRYISLSSTISLVQSIIISGYNNYNSLLIVLLISILALFISFSTHKSRGLLKCTFYYINWLKTPNDFLLHPEPISDTIIWSTRSCMIRILSDPPRSFGAIFLLGSSHTGLSPNRPVLSQPYIHVIPLHSSDLSFNAIPSERDPPNLKYIPHMFSCTFHRS